MTPRQKQIVEKSIEIIVNDGFQALTIKNLADKMNFSEPALYRHFKDKSAIIVAIIEKIREDMVSMVSKVDTNEKAKDFFLHLICNLTGYLKKVKGVTILIMSESSLEMDERVREKMYSLYTDMLNRLAGFLSVKKMKGEVRKDVDEFIAAQVFLGIIQSMVLKYHLSNKKIEIDSNCKKVIEIYLKGVLV